MRVRGATLSERRILLVRQGAETGRREMGSRVARCCVSTTDGELSAEVREKQNERSHCREAL